MKVFKNLFKRKSPAEKHRQLVSLQIKEMIKLLNKIEKNTQKFKDSVTLSPDIENIIGPMGNFYYMRDNLLDTLNRLTSEREQEASDLLVNNLIKDLKQNLVK